MSSPADLVAKIEIGRLGAPGLDSDPGKLYADIHFLPGKFSGVSPLRLSQGEIIALVAQMADEAIRNHLETLREELEE